MSEKRMPWAVGDVVYCWYAWTEGQTPDLGIAVITHVTKQFVHIEVRQHPEAFAFRQRFDREWANYALDWRRTPEAAWLAYVDRYTDRLLELEQQMNGIRAHLTKGMPNLHQIAAQTDPPLPGAGSTYGEIQRSPDVPLTGRTPTGPGHPITRAMLERAGKDEPPCR